MTYLEFFFSKLHSYIYKYSTNNKRNYSIAKINI